MRRQPIAAAVLTLAVGAGAPDLLRAQGEKRLSAREIFFTAAGSSAPAKPAPAKPAAKPAPAPKQTPPRAAGPRKPAPEKAPAAPTPAQVVGANLTSASYAPATSSYPLGIRYSLLKREGGGLNEVAPDMAFRSGDRIKVRVQTNDNGYLYIVHQGSSGNWKPLFPSPETGGGDNRVEKGRDYDIPAGFVFTFDAQPGEEKLFLVFSREPETSLEDLIYNLSAPKPAPAAGPGGPAPLKVLMAANNVRIGDGVVDQLRTVYARDLIIEKVDETTTAPSGQREKAVYVVNPAHSTASCVVADIRLDHR